MQASGHPSPPQPPSVSSWPPCCSLCVDSGGGGLLSPSNVSPGPGNQKLEMASSGPSCITDPATGGLIRKTLGELRCKHTSRPTWLCSPATQSPNASLGEPLVCSVHTPHALHAVSPDPGGLWQRVGWALGCGNKGREEEPRGCAGR